MSKTRGLGKGLSSLIPNKKPQIASKPEAQPDKNIILDVDPDDIFANPYQPRNKFEQDKLKELAISIKQHGIMSPLVVTVQADGSYQLISGERRLRASKDIGLKTVPVIVRQADNKEKLELALVENIQREDLNSIERATAYSNYMSEFGVTQKEFAKKVGKSRSEVANTVRLLDLPEKIKDSLTNGELSEGNAKVILSLKDQESQLNLWRKITLNNLTVRSAESEARSIKVKTHSRKIDVKNAELVAIEENLEEKLGTKVRIQGNINKGKVVAEYYSKEELERIVENCSN